MSTNRQQDADMDRLLRAVLKPASHEPDSAGFETRSRDREEAAHAGSETVSGACPDAGLLAAFVEGGVSGQERTALDEHILQCGRCQEVLAVLGREIPAAEDATAGVRWFTWVTRPRLRWLVPITAVATVAALFVATRSLIAPGELTTPAGVTQFAQAQPPQEAPAPAVPAQAAGEAARPDTSIAPLAKQRAEPASRQEAGKRRANLESSAKPVPDAAPAPALIGQAAVEKKVAAEAAAELAERAATDERRARPAAEPQAPQPAVAPAAAGLAAPAGAGGKMAADAPSRAVPVAAAKLDDLRSREPIATVRAEPDGTVRWQFGPGGRIWRSVDAGSTWHQQPSGVSASLVAGSAPSPTTCWAVGTGGVVLLTSDGERWTLLPFPLSVDLAAVRAVNARIATVTTRDGRRFETLDGGATWPPK